MKCDVIIPIYNAYDCLKPCIDSVINYTEFKNNKLILINDKSTDERVSKLLKKYANKYDFIEFLENEQNLGFVGTVNRGMRYSKNDVVLLNSDTEVTSNWLKKMHKCAYSREMVATVTPLSNNATLASVPKIFEKNELPEGVSLDEMAKIVEKCSYRDYPELPTGHGFCLYIKRSVLNKVGYFDDVAFKKGYGEENDFCFRCFDLGYSHLLCDDTYIYHKESQSFSSAKLELMKNGEEVLLKRYKFYKDKLQDWCLSKPISYIGENIQLALGNIEKRSNILYLIHDFKDVLNNNGGTTLHAYDLIKNLRDKYNFHVFTFEDGIYKLYSYYKDSVAITKFSGIQNFKKYEFYNEDYKNMLTEIIDNYGIDLIHIHHMKYHYFDVIDVIKEKNISSIFSVHDYYSVCPIINKLYKNQRYCDKPSNEMCGDCLKCTMYMNANMIENWHLCFNKLFETVDYIISPSQNTKEEIKKTYDIECNVIEHGIDIQHKTSKLNIDNDKQYNIAFVGAIGIHKGRNIVCDMLSKGKLGKIKIHLFGIIDDFHKKNNKNYIDHGPYKRDELSDLLSKNNIKLVCLFSICPETYSYTLTECVSAGVPVLGINIGAVGDRILKNNLGWTIEYSDNYKDYIDKINEIFNNPTEYNQIIKSINKYKIKTTKEMASEYDQLYKNTKPKAINLEKAKMMIKDSQKYVPNVSYSNYEWVFSTLKWRIISKIKLPKGIKKIIGKAKNND
ncbi:glycosyltransferase [bacterium]|mgnify:FL=1|nr:glycosyltransferase [bacterium]